DAIDVAAFLLEDGRRISVLDDWSRGTPQEREFLRLVHQSACKRFGTVLGPDYNRAHENHFHVEKVIAGKSYCR
ncbi:MAG: extensin, partial [Sphingomonadales bacterium]